MTEKAHRYRSYKKQAQQEAELQWGGSTGWTPQWDQQENVKLDNGSIHPLRTPANRVFTEDFESGTLSRWTTDRSRSGFGWNIATEPTHSGSYAAHLRAHGRGQVKMPIPELTAAGPYVTWIKQTNDPYDDVKFIWQSGSGTRLFRLNLNREVTQYVHVNRINRGWKFPYNTWVRAAVFNVDFINGTYSWDVSNQDGHVYDSGDETFDQASVTAISAFTIRVANYGKGSGDFYVDDISISDGA